MATVLESAPPRVRLEPRSAGLLLTPDEFDMAEFEDGDRWNYELINGVLVVSPPASINERDPNEELGYWLRIYRDSHAQGTAMDFTVAEHTLKTTRNRRRADRGIWTGLGRLPGRDDIPTIVVEFVSPGRKAHQRDYDAKRVEYLEVGVREYWIVDRFQEILTVVSVDSRGVEHQQVINAGRVYESSLLPGFVLRLDELLNLANRWPEETES
jgi:Uma2 family endonuclease